MLSLRTASTLAFLTMAFALTRIFTQEIAPPIEFTFFNVFKDFAHIYIGVLIGYFFALPDKTAKMYVLQCGIVLTLLETICAVITLVQQ